MGALCYVREGHRLRVSNCAHLSCPKGRFVLFLGSVGREAADIR